MSYGVSESNQPPSEHAISTIEKRATALNNKVTLPKQE